jgi:hypothetical protein
MTVRVRGIYATALTRLFDDVVLASGPIEARFDDPFPVEPAAATVETTADRQGVTLSGRSERLAALGDRLDGLSGDALSWQAALPQDGVFAGQVVEELGRGAVVDVGPGEGFLSYDATDRHVETGDALRVQVAEARAPWLDGRPVLDTTVRVRGHLASLVRAGNATGWGGSRDGAGPSLAEVVAAEPPAGWVIQWDCDEQDVPLDALGDAVAAASESAADVDEALADAEPPPEAAPGPYWTGTATRHWWFGREARFALDDHRRAVTPTMTGHHRIKAATDAASAAVDFVEAVCPGAGDEAERDDGPGDAFPFDAVTRQFGPREGASVGIGHGKPDGSLLSLGSGTVTERDPDGTLVVEREMSPGGTYDALGVERRTGDVATTKFEEGRRWYPTVYRSDEGEVRGTYVNVCTPVEVFPDAVRYVDLHVDVVKHADGTVERVDDGELDDAEAAGDLPADLAARARDVAAAIERAL